jgi:dipeptidyl aminopeptidase/acylaminoacyl peptidase
MISFWLFVVDKVRRHFLVPYLSVLIGGLLLPLDGKAELDRAQVSVPVVKDSAMRPITIDDMVALRRIETLRMSPDRTKFALLVRQGDATSNEYRGTWYVGDSNTGTLTYVGNAGAIAPNPTGEFLRLNPEWCPDGRWLAYLLRRQGEVQIWRSDVIGRTQMQVTHNAADVQRFNWSADGRALYFVAGTKRADLKAAEERRIREGYQYDEELVAYTDFMLPTMRLPLDTRSVNWKVSLSGQKESRVDQRPPEMDDGGNDGVVGRVATRQDGARAWIVGERSSQISTHIAASLPNRTSVLSCSSEQCSGHILGVWWQSKQDKVVFLRRELPGDSYGGRGGDCLYSWSPTTDRVSLVFRGLDDVLKDCETNLSDNLICVRETVIKPPHVASISMSSGEVRILVDVNPEFRNIGLGRIERLEWDTPEFAWSKSGGVLHGVYPTKAFGYILYPPNFEPAKKYPVFVQPYTATGFEDPARFEHPQHVYAANGIIVLNTQFPIPKSGALSLRDAYSAELDFPHMAMSMESTLRGLDAAIAEGSIDALRVGIGGVSKGCFISLYLIQKHDRVSAVSCSGAGRGAEIYYLLTKKGMELAGKGDWVPKPEGAGRDYWSKIDIAEHVDSIEAPILLNLAAVETSGALHLIRHMAEAGKPYDAYVFPNETHIKWQPAHLRVIQERNLDWFRFWLQGYEDSNPSKTLQYAHWRRLREQQNAGRVIVGHSD